MGQQTAEEIDARRQFVHAGWAAVAPAWGEHAAYAATRTSIVARAMFDHVAPAPGDRVLELACGPGTVGIQAAALVAPLGEVVLSDVAAEMVAIATERAAARGLTNVTTAVLDLEAIDAPDASFDLVLCAEGLMFAVDLDRAAREIVRVLRPGGRAAIGVWGPRARNPWLGLVFDALATQLGHPVPPPGVPHPFALEDASRLRTLLEGAGLADVAIDEVEVPVHAESFESWWSRTTSLAGPLALILGSLDEAAEAELLARLRDAVSPFETADGLTLPGLALVACGAVAPEV